MAQHYRQYLRGKAFELRVLAGPDLPFKQLRGPLVIADLPAIIGEIEFRAAQLLEPAAHRLMLLIKVARLRNVRRLRQFRELLIGLAVIRPFEFCAWDTVI